MGSMRGIREKSAKGKVDGIDTEALIVSLNFIHVTLFSIEFILHISYCKTR